MESRHPPRSMGSGLTDTTGSRKAETGYGILCVLRNKCSGSDNCWPHISRIARERIITDPDVITMVGAGNLELFYEVL